MPVTATEAERLLWCRWLVERGARLDPAQSEDFWRLALGLVRQFPKDPEARSMAAAAWVALRETIARAARPGVPTRGDPRPSA